MKVIYSFTAKAITPDGTKMNCSGRIEHEEGYPMSAFEAAANCVFKTSGVRPDLTKPGNVTLRKLKATTLTR